LVHLTIPERGGTAVRVAVAARRGRGRADGLCGHLPGEGALRPGYRPWRHAVSQLGLGPFGWVNTIAILAAAAALLVFAAGLGRALPTGTGSTWGPRLIGVAGACFVLARGFAGDPAWPGWARYSTPEASSSAA
jgi:hypothetical protein